MTYRPIGLDHGDFCFDTDEAHRCDACRLYGLPIDDRDARWPWTGVRVGTDHTTRAHDGATTDREQADNA